MGAKVECPADKLGQVIGKKGKNLQHLQTKSSVSVDIARKGDIGKREEQVEQDRQRHVHIFGPMHSLESAKANLDRVIATTEEKTKFSTQFIRYLLSKGVSVLTEIRASHPDVGVDLPPTRNGKQPSKTDNPRLLAPDEIRFRGITSDIASAREDLEGAASLIERETFAVDSREAALIIGKQGSVIEALAASHQVDINVESRDKEESDDKDKNKPRKVPVSIVGPSGHVLSAKREIEELLAANRETTEEIPIDDCIRQTLLMESGKGVQAVFKAVNEAIDDPTAGMVSVSFNIEDGPSAMLVKAKSRVLERAVEAAKAELRKLDIVRLSVDPVVIPVMIGKGGEGVKTLRGDKKSINIEFSKGGNITICGMNHEDVQDVAGRVKEEIEKNYVDRMTLDPYEAVIKEFFRHKAKDVTALSVVMKSVDEECQLVLRGTKENVEAAKTTITEFWDSNYIEELIVTQDEMTALLTGGKESKIVAIATATETNLRSDRERLAVTVRGKKDAVKDAMTQMKAFLRGDGEGNSAVRLQLDTEELGMYIGKGGKNRAEIEKKHNSVLIITHRNEHALSLHGPAEAVEACRVDILKLVAGTRKSQTLTYAPTDIKAIEASRVHRKIMGTSNVVISFEDTNKIVVKGPKSDVRDAVSLIEEAAGKKCKVGYYFEQSLYQLAKEACSDPKVIERIEKLSSAKVTLDDKEGAVMFTADKRAGVAKAKEEVLKFLSFMFGARFARLDVPEAVLVSMRKAGAALEITAASGAQAVLDRDLNTVLFFARDGAIIEKAVEAAKSVVKSETKLIRVIQLEQADEWMISNLVGKKGARIRSLRDETKCKIDIDGTSLKITVSADSEDSVSAGTQTITDIIDKNRRENLFVSLAGGHMAAFVGKGGAKVNEFAEKHSISITLMKKGSEMARFSGEPEKVAAAKTALDNWIAERDEKAKEALAEATVQLNRDKISKVIGIKGTVIRGLEREFGCRIDVNKDKHIVTVRGATRYEAIEKIKTIANTEDDEEGEVNGATETNNEDTNEERNEKEKVKRSTPERKKRESPKADTAKPEAPPKQQRAMTASDFPSLGGSVQPKAAAATDAPAGGTWANLLKDSAGSIATVPTEDSVPEN